MLGQNPREVARDLRLGDVADQLHVGGQTRIREFQQLMLLSEHSFLGTFNQSSSLCNRAKRRPEAIALRNMPARVPAEGTRGVTRDGWPPRLVAMVAPRRLNWPGRRQMAGPSTHHLCSRLADGNFVLTSTCDPSSSTVPTATTTTFLPLLLGPSLYLFAARRRLGPPLAHGAITGRAARLLATAARQVSPVGEGRRRQLRLASASVRRCGKNN